MPNKLPAFQFYPGDWLKDPRLRICSHTAKGVYVDMLCLMFECDERGVLATAGRAWSDEDIARAVGGDLSVTLSGICELVDKGVVSRQGGSPEGAIYSRRMVRDENKRRLCSEAGKTGGGNPALTYKGDPKGTPKGIPKGRSKGEGGSSSSSSSSSSDNPIVPFGLNDGDENVETLYQSYPRHAGRAAALKAIRSALRKIAFPVLHEAVRAYAASRVGKDAQYTPHPATWFNQERWADDRGDWGAGEPTDDAWSDWCAAAGKRFSKMTPEERIRFKAPFPLPVPRLKNKPQ